MGAAKVYAGIDVSRDVLDVHLHPLGLDFRVTRDVEGYQALVKCLRRRSPSLLVLEATGGFERAPAQALRAAGFRAAVVNPRLTRAFARATGRYAKTDRIDAKVLALYAEALRPDPRPLVEGPRKSLSAIMRQDRVFLRLELSERNRRRRATEPTVVAAIDDHLAFLATARDHLKDLTNGIMDASPAFTAIEALLSTVPAVGPYVSRTLIAEMPELGQLNGKQIAALAGLAPFSRDSGTLSGRRRIFGGRPVVRQGLYQSAVVASRWNPQIAPMYQRLRAAGKPAKVAFVACARKLLVILNAMMRDGMPWQDGPPTARLM